MQPWRFVNMSPDLQICFFKGSVLVCSSIKLFWKTPSRWSLFNSFVPSDSSTKMVRSIIFPWLSTCTRKEAMIVFYMTEEFVVLFFEGLQKDMKSFFIILFIESLGLEMGHIICFFSVFRYQNRCSDLIWKIINFEIL